MKKLIGLGDGFVVLQGGTGTLLELAAAWEYSNKSLIDIKPITCHSSIWKTIVFEMNDQMKLEGRSADMVKTFDTIDEIVEYLRGSLAIPPKLSS